MITVLAAALAVGALALVLLIRPHHLPPPEPASPTAHLEQRRKTVYDNLRDLQFEYRLGKLSDADYQEAKKLLQQELAQLTAAIEGKRASAHLQGPKASAPNAAAGGAPPSTPPTQSAGNRCPHCGALFAQPLKFCGECGRPMLGGDS
ncbi:MAG: hypothetical protein K6T61_03585 [Bryobacteraceae bacterium]|nr:hypothetical protein [Bryobacteraceae bacterium]